MAIEGMLKEIGRIMIKGDEMYYEMERGKDLGKVLDRRNGRIENRC